MITTKTNITVKFLFYKYVSFTVTWRESLGKMISFLVIEKNAYKRLNIQDKFILNFKHRVHERHLFDPFESLKPEQTKSNKK